MSYLKKLRKAEKAQKGWVALVIFLGFSGLMRFFGFYGSGESGSIDLFSISIFVLSVTMAVFSSYQVKKFRLAAANS